MSFAIASFALTLRGSGFNDAGCVRHNNRGCDGKGQGCAPQIVYRDIASGAVVGVDRGDAMRQAVSGLSVVSFQTNLNATQINLLANLTAWSVSEAKSTHTQLPQLAPDPD